MQHQLDSREPCAKGLQDLRQQAAGGGAHEAHHQLVDLAALGALCGAMEDRFYLATGRQLWDASLIQAATLILRSERDFWSRPEDPQQLAAQLVHAPEVRVVVIPEATHHVHLDRPERGRTRFLDEALSFLSQSRSCRSARSPMNGP